MASVVPQEQKKAEQSLALKALAWNYCGGGEKVDKKQSIYDKSLLLAHRANKLELQIWRMQGK